MGRGQRDAAVVERVIASLQLANLDVDGFESDEAALLTYADKLTLDPASVTPGDIDALREAGFDDLAIHDACAIVSYFAFVNRIADGLGVELETTGASAAEGASGGAPA